MVTDSDARRSGKGAAILIGSIMVLAIVLGVVAYWRFTLSQQHIRANFHRLDKHGATLDAEGCVTAVLDWHDHCDAIDTLCDHAVPMAMEHCLRASDRSKDCAALGETARDQWTYEKCKARGIIKGRSSVVNACTDAYRALAQFCRSGQEGVIL